MANTKICSKCGKRKLFSKFYKHKGNNKSGLDSQCKACKDEYNKRCSKTARHKSQVVQYNKTARRKSQMSRSTMKHNLKRMYGMTLGQYDEMVENQNGVCMICEKPEINRRLSVDHDHKTGKVRGLLCCRCNFALGIVEDDGFVIAAKKYLRKY